PVQTLHQCVDLGAGEDDHARYPDLGHEADRCAERPVSLVVVAKIGRVPGEQNRRDNPKKRRQTAAPSDPVPLGMHPVRAKAANSAGQRASMTIEPPIVWRPAYSSATGSTTMAAIASKRTRSAPAVNAKDTAFSLMSPRRSSAI